MEELYLLGDVCSHIEDTYDRYRMINKFIIPRLNDFVELENNKLFKMENMNEMFKNSLGDVLNLLNNGPISCILNYNNLNVESIHEFQSIDWVNYNFYGKCQLCQKYDFLNCCEIEHDSECQYKDITSDQGCQIKFCDDCIYLDCNDEQIDCEAIRCEKCFE